MLFDFEMLLSGLTGDSDAHQSGRAPRRTLRANLGHTSITSYSKATWSNGVIFSSPFAT